VLFCKERSDCEEKAMQKIKEQKIARNANAKDEKN